MIKQISLNEFDLFTKSHKLSSFYQTSYYAKSLIDENYELIGYFKDNILLSASLIILKEKNSKYKYAISPKGFILDYYDDELLTGFTKEIKEYYKKQAITYITINPEISIGYYDRELNKCIQNNNFYLKSFLNSKGYINNDESNYLIPVTNLKKYNELLDSKLINEYNDLKFLGLKIEKTNEENIYKIYDFFKTNNSKLSEIVNFISNFKDNIDIFYVKIDYNDYLEKSREILEDETERNNYLNKLLQINNNEENLNKKMESDALLNKFRENLTYAISHVESTNNILGGIITIKYNNRVYLYKIGYKNISSLDLEKFIFIELFNYYCNYYDYFTLTTETVRADSKLIKYSTDIMQMIGNYDLVIDKIKYTTKKVL